jgi:hypothetical protein
MKKCLLIFYTFALLGSYDSLAQGCSDAGFCTMGAMKPDQPFNKKIALRLRSMEVSFYRGTTTLTPVIYVATADLNFSLNAKTSFQVKLPYQAVRGRLANTSGMGDISLCVTRTLLSKEHYDISLSLGTKIPTNKSDKDVNGLPLPMYYQTSLGTYDAIAGISLVSRRWLFATGIQMPLNKNGNQFVWKDWAESPEAAYADRYNQAKDLKRGTDIMLRVERNFRYARFNFSLGVLPIYRITRDEFTRSGTAADSPETRIVHPDAKGLALSGIFTAGYNFNVRTGVKVLLGHKVNQVIRKINPDGLTREFVSTISYYYRF